jgi:hypothetical protein
MNEFSQSHRIRLMGPWIVKSLAGDEVGKVKLPGLINLGAINEMVESNSLFCRSFGFPKSLDQNEDVFLTIDPGIEIQNAKLNGEKLTLAKVAAGRLETIISTLILVRNQLELEMKLSGQRFEWLSEIALEIRLKH